MEKTKLIGELGYYHPSYANWSYHIFMIVDQTGARLYKATFGGDERVKGDNLERLHLGKGSGVEYKWKDIKDLPDIESYNGKNY